MRWALAIAILAVLLFVGFFVVRDRGTARRAPLESGLDSGRGGPGTSGRGTGRDGPPEPIPLLPDGGQAYRLAGRVVDSRGRAIAGARVWMVEGHMDQIWGDERDVATDEAGAFGFEGVMMGNCKVWVSAHGYAGVFRNESSGDCGLRFVLHRAASVSGVVVDAEGKPARARMLKIFQGLMHPTEEYDFDEIDGSGRFQYGHLPPGEFRIRAVTKDGLEADLTMDLSEGVEHRDVRMRLAPPWRSYVRIRLVGNDTRDLEFYRTTGDPRIERDGNEVLFLYRRPPGSRVTIRVERGREPAADLAAKTVASRQARPHEITLPKPVPVRFETQAGVGKVRVAVWRGDEQVWLDGTPDRLSPACEYDVRFVAEGYRPHEVFGWRPTAENGVLKATLRPAATVRGVLVDGDGQPIGKGRILVDGKGVEYPVAADGRFVVAGVEPGDRAVFADVDRVRVAAKRFRAVGGEIVDVGELVAHPTRRITGRVRDEDGRAVGGVEVTFVALLRVDEHSVGWTDDTSTHSHADGRFDFAAPGVGGFLIVRKKGFGTVPAAVGTDLELVVPRPARLRVTADRGAVTWTCSIRWPAIHPAAVWETGTFAPCELEVAPGAVEVVGEFDPWRMGPTPPELVGTRTRSAVCVAGETAQVVLER